MVVDVGVDDERGDRPERSSNSPVASGEQWVNESRSKSMLSSDDVSEEGGQGKMTGGPRLVLGREEKGKGVTAKDMGGDVVRVARVWGRATYPSRLLILTRGVAWIAMLMSAPLYSQGWAKEV